MTNNDDNYSSEDEEDDDYIPMDNKKEDEKTIYARTNITWKRKRLESEDFTSTNEIKEKSIVLFESLASVNQELSIVDILKKYKNTYSNTSDIDSNWVVSEIETIVSKSRNPSLLRLVTVCSELRSIISSSSIEDDVEDESSVEDEDSDEDSDEDNKPFIIEGACDVADLLMALYETTKLEHRQRETDPLEEGISNMVKFKRLISSISGNLKLNQKDYILEFFKGLPEEKQKHYLDLMCSMKNNSESTTNSEVPYLLRLMDFNIDDVTRQTIFDHVSSFEAMSPGSSEYNKKQNLVKAIKRLPFGKSAKCTPELIEALKQVEDQKQGKRTSKRIKTNCQDKLVSYLESVQKNLDKNIYGHKEAKNQTMRLIASMISNGTSKGGHCFGLCGPPGVGKTQIALEIAKAFGRPYVKMNMGGASNADDWLGHGYTYEGSTFGSLSRSMMDADCENPVMIFEEIDKLSGTDKGKDIENVFIHLTDSTQNHLFQDKYMPGVNIDFSRVVMIFCMNDETNISAILRDRMKIIHVDGYKINDKVVIAKKHLIPSIKKELMYKDCNYMFDDAVIRDIINQYTFEGGIRRLKELLTDIMMEINLRKLTGQKIGGIDPSNDMVITKSIIRDDIFKDKHFVQHTMVSETNQIGLVNGLWANSWGVGGLIPIEAHIIPTPSKFDLVLTGMQGDVMKESMNVAKTIVWRLLPKARKKQLLRDWKKNGATGAHIHIPDGSTRKEGPSAGAACATSLFSLLTETLVDQSYAMTGEINSKGDITAIGGLEEKTFGAITAGVKTILYPKENQRDCDKIKEKFPELFDKSSKTYIEMIPVSRIEEILDRVLIKV